MNKKLKASALLSITVLLTISVVALSEIPEAEAKKWKGKPDFKAKINIPNDPAQHNGEKGVAKFWVKGEGENMKIYYKVKLKKIGVGQIGPDGTGQPPANNPFDHYLWKLHIHPFINGVHDPSVHHFNAIGPADDPQIKIKNNKIKGVWDFSDFENRKILPMPLHETEAPHTVIENMCRGETDINVHLEHDSHLQVRGQIVPTSDYCEEILDDLEDEEDDEDDEYDD